MFTHFSECYFCGFFLFIVKKLKDTVTDTDKKFVCYKSIEKNTADLADLFLKVSLFPGAIFGVLLARSLCIPLLLKCFFVKKSAQMSFNSFEVIPQNDLKFIYAN